MLVVEKITLADFATRFLNLDNFDDPCSYDISNLGIEILSHDGQEECFKRLTHFVVKDSVDSHYKLGDLEGTSVHRVLYNKEWVELQNHPHAKLVEKSMKVVDVSVHETECYVAMDQINHNTTPGGAAIPFHSSVRIKLGAGSQIENDKKEIIGINVSAKTVKNKVGPPFRTCNFQIHFGKGIVEHEEIFDILRAHGEETVSGHRVSCSGEGAWKKLDVIDPSGKPIIEKKFYKSDFNEILANKEYSRWIDTLLERAMVKLAVKVEDIEIDPDSYEDVRSVASLIAGDNEFVSPE